MRILIADGKRLQLLRYPGSKGRVVEELVSLFPSHHTYIEPFGGSYVVLLHKKRSKIESINDVDPGITSLAYCYLFYPDELLQIAGTDLHSQGLWKRLADETDGDMFHQAVRKLYTIYHSFGAKGESFNYYVNEANKAKIVLNKEIVFSIRDRLTNVHIFSEDFRTYLNRFSKVKNGFIYLDPPYTVTEKGNHYDHNFKEQDHLDLFESLSSFESSRCKWLMSYDRSPFIEKLYEDYYFNELELFYSLDQKERGKKYELLISNYDYSMKHKIEMKGVATYFPTIKASPKV